MTVALRPLVTTPGTCTTCGKPFEVTLDPSGPLVLKCCDCRRGAPDDMLDDGSSLQFPHCSTWTRVHLSSSYGGMVRDLWCPLCSAKVLDGGNVTAAGREAFDAAEGEGT